ncbi:MAG: hypothetical protein M3Q19_12190 [Pseudomonadota bacterium]|nr:hypothetical protein [Pseudomonadota bacterium]
MKRITLAAAAMAVVAPFGLGGAAMADPGDYHKKQWEKRADCDKKLFEAKSRRDFYKTAAECNRELAKLNREQRKEVAKEWREAEKKWRERHREWRGDYYDWDD